MTYPTVYVTGRKVKNTYQDIRYLTDYDYYYILEEIGRQYKIEFEIYVEIHSNDEGN